ncbi:MAG: GTPase HflX [Desulfobulbus propionicus]|nr:MAG: GTPase HflX [Desulfobulbus propionicus]
MGAVAGNKSGLKTKQLRALERLAQKKIAPDEVIGRDTARTLATLSTELNRQIGLLIHRSGAIAKVVVGDFDRIVIPALPHTGTAGGRLRGLRCVHTTFRKNGINEEDVMDMACLRLDLMAVLTLDENLPELLHTAHLLPRQLDGRDWAVLDPVHPAHQHVSCIDLIESIERELVRERPIEEVNKGRDRALLISVTTGSKPEAQDSMDELVELARSADVEVLGQVIQRRKQIHPKFILGRGKLMEIVLKSLRLGVNLLLFDQELSPSQIRSVTDNTDLRVIDRTQLILDIFASRARSREGKLQIEMAQLKYMLPKLTTRDDALSRLTGGIGARGPGETRLEIDRRRIHDRIARLAKELKSVGKQRYHRRNRRRKRDVPIISLVGYTNAGKSTLLNTLTKSEIQAEDLLFATLDPTSRRLRFPQDLEVIVTDTVGFIRNLPAELLKAFESTLEELFEADLLLHVVDISNPQWKQQIEVVESLLHQLELENIPSLTIFNKIDKLEAEQAEHRIKAGGGIGISAIDPATLSPLLTTVEQKLQKTLQIL